LFILHVEGGEYLGGGLSVKNEIEEREEWLGGVYGHVVVWDLRWGATNVIELRFGEPKTC
jgi:hypothetical protein